MPGSVGQSTIGFLPWQGAKGNTNFPDTNFAADSAVLGMGFIRTSPNGVTAQRNWDVWCDAGTWKICEIAWTYSGTGIATYTFDGVSAGTIDHYTVGTVKNVYTEITGISLATPSAARNFKVATPTKNASSSDYELSIQSLALIRTSGTASTPNGSDTPGYTWQTLGWTGTKSNTNWATITQSSSELGGGRLVTDTTAQNNLFTDDVWIDTGTYKVALVYGKDTTQGIFNITGVNGTQTVDSYAAAPASNNYSEVTGVTVATAATMTVQVQMATKNASASAYGGKLNSMSWIRTGA